MTGRRLTVLDANSRTAAMVLLLAEATTNVERYAVIRLALRGGLMWRCHPCKTNHYLSTDTCTCGAARPAHLPVPERNPTS
ncbi:hypothetical protein [Streptomyces cyaneofuscatus]|uniref:hypothetical protein n=1 Tax=Streptomyces cyaneofuscatus TaxID=66883 RepID=UPI0036DA8856